VREIRTHGVMREGAGPLAGHLLYSTERMSWVVGGISWVGSGSAFPMFSTRECLTLKVICSATDHTKKPMKSWVFGSEKSDIPHNPVFCFRQTR